MSLRYPTWKPVTELLVEQCPCVRIRVWEFAAEARLDLEVGQDDYNSTTFTEVACCSASQS